MRLRFRGACWDATISEPFPTAPSTDVPRANTKPRDPLGFFAEVLGGSSFSALRGFTLLPRSCNTVVTPQPPVIRWRWYGQHGVRLRCKGSTGVHENLERPPDTKEDTAEEEAEDTNRPDNSPTRTCDILTSSPFCAVVSDPATAPLREPTFSEIMLFDGHGREYLFSVTQEMLLKTLTAVCLRENALLANSPSRGPSLRHLLECVRKATRELRIDTGRTDDDTEGWQSPASSVTGVPLEQCFVPAATFDLHEEVPLHLLERIPEDDPLLHADIVRLPTGLNDESSKRVVEESWRATGVEHLLRPLQVPSLSFDVAQFSPLWVTRGSSSYIGRAGEPRWGREVPMGTKTGAHTVARVLLPVDRQENLTSTFHPMAANGATFTRIDVEESARDPDLRLQASLERSSLLDAVGSLNREVRVGTLSEQLLAQMRSDLQVIDRHRPSLRGKYPTIPLASPRRPTRKKRGFHKGCRREKPQSVYARGQSSLEIDYDHFRVDEECARTPMLWDALNMVKWSTTDKATIDTPEGYLTLGRRYCLKSGALEVSRVPLGRPLGEDPKSMTDRLLNKILVSWRKMDILAITEKEQPSRVLDQVPTRKRSASPHPDPPQHQRQLQPLLPLSRASDDHSIRRAAPSPHSNPGNLCHSTGENVTRGSDGAPGNESTTKGETSPPVAKQVDPSHSKIAPSASRGKEGSVSKVNPVNGGDADKEETIVKQRSTGMPKLLQSAHQKEGGIEPVAAVGDTTEHPNKSKVAGMTSSIYAIMNGLPSEVRQGTDKRSKMPCNAEDTSTPNKLTKGLGEAPGKRRCLEGIASKRPTPVQLPLLEASDTAASGDPHNHGKGPSPEMSQQSKPSPVDLPCSSSSMSPLAGDKTLPDVLPPEQRQPMHLPQNDATRCGGKTSSPTRTTMSKSASHKTTGLTASRAQTVLTESIGGPVARENPALPCRESSSKKQLPKRGRTSTKIVREYLCPTLQPSSSPTEGDPGLDVCESERHRAILSMIRAGAVEEAFRFCGGKAVSGSLTRCGPTSVVPGLKNSRRASASGYEDVLDFDVDKSVAKGNPLCAIVSGHFVEVAGPTVLALSSDRTAAEASQRILKSHHTLTTRVSNQSTVKSRRTRAFSFLELPVDTPVDLIIGSRTGVVIIDNRNPVNSSSAGRNKGAVPPEGPSTREAPMVIEAKEKFRLLTLQTLKYSSVWLIVQMDKVRADSQARNPKARPFSVIDRLEQWLVGFPCQVLIRYSHSEVHLAELITHAALAERQREAAAIGGAGSASVVVREKRRRLETSPVVARSPLDEVEEHSRNDPEWAAVHHRQALFLQLFPSLNAFSASVLLSAVSLKHLLVSPYEELAPAILRREGGKGARGGVDAESLRDFCATIRFEGRGKMSPG